MLLPRRGCFRGEGIRVRTVRTQEREPRMKPLHKPMSTTARAWWLAILLLVLLLAPLTGAALEEHPPPQAGEVGWQRAVRLRTQLETSPAGQRTAERFLEVIDAFRQIYRMDPNIPRAPAAAAAVADLLVEQGRLLHQPGPLRAALLQYELLRKQYPRSEQVRMALLLEAEICRQDLRDMACAQQKLRAVIAAYPGTSFAEQAEMELRDLNTAPVRAPNPPPTAFPTERTGTAAPPETVAQVDETPEPVAPAPHRNQSLARKPAAAPLLPMDGPTPGGADDSTATAQPEQSVSRAYEPAQSMGPIQVTGIRHWSNAGSTRIAIDLTGKAAYESGRLSNPDRIYFDLRGAHLSPSMRSHPTDEIKDDFLHRVRTAQFKADVTRVVLDVNNVWEYAAFLLPNPWRLIIDVHGAGKGPVQNPGKLPTPGSEPMSAPTPRQSGRNSLEAGPADDGGMGSASREQGDGKRTAKHGPPVRTVRVAIDAGHGGRDSGTLGPGGIEEKEVVLDVALRTGSLLEKKPGVEIVYTRSNDSYVPLEMRTEIANRAQADLFLSIHGNSSPEASARGVETYYLNAAGNSHAMSVAARENALSKYSAHQVSDLARTITLKEKIEQSRVFAVDVDQGLFTGLKGGNAGLRDRGAKRAPFAVLIGAQMPSVLAEISFLTNPQDARKLADPDYRQRIALALSAGVAQYLKSLKPMAAAKPAAKPATRAEAKSSRRALRDAELAQANGQRGGS